jgi:hypothetical protein
MWKLFQLSIIVWFMYLFIANAEPGHANHDAFLGFVIGYGVAFFATGFLLIIADLFGWQRGIITEDRPSSSSWRHIKQTARL